MKFAHSFMIVLLMSSLSAGWCWAETNTATATDLMQQGGGGQRGGGNGGGGQRPPQGGGGGGQRPQPQPQPFRPAATTTTDSPATATAANSSAATTDQPHNIARAAHRPISSRNLSRSARDHSLSRSAQVLVGARLIRCRSTWAFTRASTGITRASIVPSSSGSGTISKS